MKTELEDIYEDYEIREQISAIAFRVTAVDARRTVARVPEDAGKEAQRSHGLRESLASRTAQPAPAGGI